ncbi:MAG: hypothetical protein HY700_17910 [Gemmatimonadetes bacterium]|nr:hypothetical protein [Gemmatimonadota bacterium]
MALATADHLPQFRGSRPQSHPYSKPVSSLPHHRRDHSKEAHRSQSQSGNREDRE